MVWKRERERFSRTKVGGERRNCEESCSEDGRKQVIVIEKASEQAHSPCVLIIQPDVLLETPFVPAIAIIIYAGHALVAK